MNNDETIRIDNDFNPFEPKKGNNDIDINDILGNETVPAATEATAAAAKGLGWKAYSAAGVSAVALTGGALAGFKAMAGNNSVKVMPKADSEEFDTVDEIDEPDFSAEVVDDTDPSSKYSDGDQPEYNYHNDDSSDYSEPAEAAHTAPAAAHGAAGQIALSDYYIIADDDMSFAEAFATARQMAGPGGTFEWHGQVFSTYYREEWDSMTPAQHQEYFAHTQQVIHSIDESHNMGGNEYAYNGPSNGPEQPDVVDEIDMTLGDIRTLDFDDSSMTVGDAIIDGHQAGFIDVDNDGVFDLLGIDADDDGELNENEYVNIQDQEITIEDFQQAAREYNPMAYNADLDDFTNNADVSDFA